jgi:hypothetical protein
MLMPGLEIAMNQINKDSVVVVVVVVAIIWPDWE